MTALTSDGGLERQIAILQGMREGITAAEVAPYTDAFMRGQMDKGQTPEGEAWLLTKDGRKALRGAAAAFVQRVVGNAIIMIVKGRHAFHHFGAGYSPARRQLPEGKLPKRLGDAIRSGAVDWFKAKTRAGKRGYSYYFARGMSPANVNGSRRAA